MKASGRNFSFDVPQPCEDELSTTESSEVVNSDQNIRFQGHQAARRDHWQNSENNVEFPIPHSYSVNSPPFSGMPPTNGRDDASQISNEDSEDICKEVRCIEMNEKEGNGCLDTSAVESNSLQDSNNASNPPVNSGHHDVSPITLEQYLENVRKPFANLVKNLGSSTHNSSSSKVMGRSRSCRSLMGSTLKTWRRMLAPLRVEDSWTSQGDLKGVHGDSTTMQRVKLYQGQGQCFLKLLPREME
jgi:centromeric protein E